MCREKLNGLAKSGGRRGVKVWRNGAKSRAPRKRTHTVTGNPHAAMSSPRNPLGSPFDPEGYYARLGVQPRSGPEIITAAYRRKARLVHPDVYPGDRRRGRLHGAETGL